MTGLLFVLTFFTASAREVVVTLPEGVTPAALRGPHIGFSEGGTGRTRHLQVDDRGLATLNALGIPWAPVPPPPPDVPDGYHGPEAMEAALDALVAHHPERVRRVDVGWSVEGRPIVGVRISDTDTPAATWRVLGAHHGDELVSGEVALDIARTLSAPGGPADGWLDRVAIVVVPHVNPDGVAAVTRHNAENVDLNRNYGFEWSHREYQPGSGPFSEPETRAIRALNLRGPAVLALSLHSGAANFGWVWNYTYTRSPDEARHRALGEAYLDTCSTPGFWITNGADWYPTNGDTTDWSYGRFGTFDYTLELSTDKAPAADTLDSHLDHHRAAITAFFVDTPLHTGQVIDATTGLPVRARVARTTDGQPFETGDDGRFARVQTTGEDTYIVSAPGYTDAELDRPDGTLVALSPTQTRPAVTVSPAVVRREDRLLTVQVQPAPESVSVQPPGHPLVPLTPTDTGFVVDGEGLPPGAWPVHVDGQPTRTLLLVDSADTTPLTSAHLDHTTLTLTHPANDAGRTALIYQDGQLADVQPILHTGHTLTVDLSRVAPDARIDVAIHAAGGPVWVADVFDGAWTASEAPPGTDGLDTGQQSMPGEFTACGCTSAPRPPAPFAWLVLAGWIWRRRP